MRQSIPVFADHTWRLHEALKAKRMLFYLTEKEKEQFLDIKDALTKTPTLAFPDLSEGAARLELFSDGSSRAIAATLTQKQGGFRRVLGYTSRILRQSEIGYPISLIELLALVHACHSFRSLLIGRPFTPMLTTKRW